MDQFDVVVIGAGPAGYVAAIRAAQLGLKTACVDAFIGKDGKRSMGVTGHNVAFIPSKALLESPHRFHDQKQGMAAPAISLEKPAIDMNAMNGRKDKIVKKFTGGIPQLL